MIRVVDFNPYTSYPGAGIAVEPEAEWKSSLRYLESYGSVFYQTILACRIIDKMNHLKELSPATSAIAGALAPLSRAAQVAHFVLSADGHIQKEERDLEGTLNVVAQGVDVATWISEVESLAVSTRIISSLNSVGLGLSFIISMVELITLLRDESLDYKAVGKTTVNIGLALLAIYLFMTAVTLSDSLSLLVTGVGVAVSLI
jgi:hypothetical protein